MRGVRSLIITAALATTAAAEPDADAQFRVGREMIAAGRLADACDAFAASQQARPRVATLLNLADCQEQRGLFADAHETFVKAQRLARERGDQRREAEASRRILALEPRLAPPPVVAVVPPSVVTSLPATTAPAEPAAVRAVSPHASRTFAIGALVGMNVQRESLLGGIRVVGAMDAPRGEIRAIGTVQFSQYNDEPSQPAYVTRTYSVSGSVDYLWMPRPTLLLGGGLGIGADYDSVSPMIESPDPDVQRLSDVGSFFTVRLTPIALRLRDGAMEIGLHLATQVASDEVTFTALFAADWYLW